MEGGEVVQDASADVFIAKFLNNGKALLIQRAGLSIAALIGFKIGELV